MVYETINYAIDRKAVKLCIIIKYNKNTFTIYPIKIKLLDYCISFLILCVNKYV